MNGDTSKCYAIVENNKCYSTCPNNYKVNDNIYCELKCSLINDNNTCNEKFNECIWIEENEDIINGEGHCINKVLFQNNFSFLSFFIFFFFSIFLFFFFLFFF
jgi:hypothetical protein